MRYKNLAEDYEETIASQAADIYDLEQKNDELMQAEKGTSLLGSKLSIELDEVILKAQGEIAKLNLCLFEMKSSNRELLAEREHKKAECKFLEAEL
jgi:hypothetical protein